MPRRIGCQRIRRVLRFPAENRQRPSNPETVMDQEHKETIERTIIELESQQMTVQQLVAEALSDLEAIYSEIEEQSQLMAEMPSDVEESDNDVELAATSEQLQELQQEIASLQEERRELETQLLTLRKELEVVQAATSIEPGGDTSEAPSQPTGSALLTAPAPNAAAIHAPFDRLRERLSSIA